MLLSEFEFCSFVDEMNDLVWGKVIVMDSVIVVSRNDF